ncbi:type 1 glutamine amidotransferase [Marinicella sp. W31]|uniref:type 1 glutamine amidotransferase n=1 Tax=Marinicella sp. W31 TaxID=3023713 RepID=UPI003756EC9B
MNCSESASDTVLIVKHHIAEGPGRILQWLTYKGLSTHILEFDQQLPIDDKAYAGLILLGGPASANSDCPRLTAERELLAKFRAAGKPVLGICLGAQLLAQSLGCKVESLANAELGWTKVSCLNGHVMVPQWHSDEVIPNTHITVLGHSTQCANQMFIADKSTLGVQFHPEWHKESIEELHRYFPECPVPLDQQRQYQPLLEDFFWRILELWWLGILDANMKVFNQS